MKLLLKKFTFASRVYLLEASQSDYWDIPEDDSGITYKQKALLATLGTSESPNFTPLSFAARLICDDVIEWAGESSTSLGELPQSVMTVLRLARDGHLAELTSPASRARLLSDCGVRDDELPHLDHAFTHLTSLPLVDTTGVDGDRLFLSPDPALNKLYANCVTELTADNILLVLAAAGINVCFPSVLPLGPFDADETLEQLKEQFPEERQEYINYLRGFIEDCYERVVDGKYHDAWKYAEMATNQRILQHCRKFEKAAQKGDKDLLSRIRIGAVEGIPTIAEAFIDPTQSGLAVAAHELLKVLCKSIADRESQKEMDDLGHVSYIYQLRSLSSQS